MPLTFTRDELERALLPLGYQIEEEADLEDTVYLAITHFDHRGIVIELSYLVEECMIDQMSREVVSGVESRLYDEESLTQDEYDSLAQAQRDHIYNIRFGEQLDRHDDFEDMNELIELIEDKIRVQAAL